MAHLRTQIRQAIVTALTGLPTTGPRVFPGRALPLDGINEVPGLLIYTYPDLPVYEEEEGGEMGGRGSPMHYLTLQVEGYYGAGNDDNLDQMAVEVEEALFADPTFGGLTQWLELGEQDVGRDAAGRRLEGVITMTFQVGYLAAAGNPQGT